MIDHVLRFTIPAAYALLPEPMRSDRATAFMLAVGLQESSFTTRHQFNRGPAHGFWQFERTGVRGVLAHPRTHELASAVIDALCYRHAKASPARQALEIFNACADNDTLACCLARLLLWTLPTPLPGPEEADAAYGQYLAAWRPGKPRPDVWGHNYAEAWGRVNASRAGTSTDDL